MKNARYLSSICLLEFSHETIDSDIETLISKIAMHQFNREVMQKAFTILSSLNDCQCYIKKEKKMLKMTI